MTAIKKITAPLLCLAIILALPFAASAAGKRYLVTATRANLLPEPDLMTEPVGEAPGGTYVYATDETDDFLYVRLNAAGVSGWVHKTLVAYADADARTRRCAAGVCLRRRSIRPGKKSYTSFTARPAGLRFPHPFP